MKKLASSYSILEKIVTSFCRVNCRNTTGTRISAPFSLWSSVIRVSKISWLTHPPAFSLTTWIMIPVLFMNSRDWYAISFKTHYLKSSILRIVVMVVQVL